MLLTHIALLLRPHHLYIINRTTNNGQNITAKQKSPVPQAQKSCLPQPQVHIVRAFQFLVLLVKCLLQIVSLPRLMSNLGGRKLTHPIHLLNSLVQLLVHLMILTGCIKHQVCKLIILFHLKIITRVLWRQNLYTRLPFRVIRELHILKR